jgi:LPXTG-motif cell wall-anchored protein
VVADVNGNFTVTVTVPADLAPGQHTLVASGVDTMGNLRFVTLPVTVTGLAYTGADIAVPAIGGLAALTAGGALIFVARRRKVS